MSASARPHSGSPGPRKDRDAQQIYTEPGRRFAGWIGLVPRHTGTGGRVRQLGISKRGDA